MAKTNFVPGTVVTSTFLNAINNPVFSNLNLDGHIPLITDDDLADGGIKTSVTELTRSLLVESSSGTSVTVNAGTFTTLTGDSDSVTETVLSLPTDGVNYVYIDGSGTLAFGEVLPTISLPLAKVTTGSGVITQNLDIRPRYQIRPQSLTIPVKGGTGSQKAFKVVPSGVGGWNVDNTEFTAIGDASSPYELSGQYDFTNFTVQSGAKLVTRGLYIKASGTVNIAGTIEVEPTINGGAGFNGSLLIRGDILSNNGSGIGGSGGHSQPPMGYDWGVSKSGSGGGSSFVKGRLTASGTFADESDSALISSGSGGKGGSFLMLEVAGELVVAGTITANGGDGQNTLYTSGLGANQYILASGSGGGSGGLIHLYSITSVELTPTATLSCDGGNGGVGYISPSVETDFTCRGGGGGSGGFIVLHSPSITNSAGSNVTLDGGLAGSDVGTGVNSLAGCPGAAYGNSGGSSASPGQSGQLVTLTFL